MFKNKELIKDINKLRNNVNIKKYDNLQSNLKDFGNLLYEDFGKEWENEIIHNELLRYKKHYWKYNNKKEIELWKN